METLFIETAHDNLTPLEHTIYAYTFSYLRNNITSSVSATLSDTHSFFDILQSHDISIAVATKSLPRTTAHLLQKMHIVTIIIGYCSELIDICDITIDPLYRDKSLRIKGFFGPRFLLRSSVQHNDHILIAHSLRISPEELTEELQHNEAETDLVEICSLFNTLPWDSTFFGFNIAYITCLRLTPTIEKLIKRYTREHNITLIEYLCNCHDRISVKTAEQAGYSFVDIRLTYYRFLNKNDNTAQLQEYYIAKGTKEDIPFLVKIAHDLYIDSRYYFDGNFDKQKVIDFYTGWVTKAIYGTFDNFAYVLYNKDNRTPVGFCTIKYVQSQSVKIGLLGIDMSIQGQGLAHYLLQQSLNYLYDSAKRYVEVSTQGRNYEAQRLYQKCGFITKKTELWYHKWTNVE